MDKIERLTQEQFKAHDNLLKEINKVRDPEQSLAILKAFNQYCLAVFKVNQERLSISVDALVSK
jgi:hypothetical protein